MADYIAMLAFHVAGIRSFFDVIVAPYLNTGQDIQLTRCTWKGFRSFKCYVLASVVAANLLTMARKKLAPA